MPEVDADVLVSTEFADDAAVVRIGGDERRALVMTADVIAPLVDDPEQFGEIAATNAISDVYAMGGRPLFALNLAFFPDDELPLDILGQILQGGARACKRMGVAIVGGHTVRDGDIKYGLSVVGEVNADAVLSNRGARPGQALVLSKALGTGIIGTAIKKGLASAAEASAAVASMTSHNGLALEVARQFRVSACTDVTGFGLLG
ncbi:MAG: selenide, water dikinase SelD, partial [Myxococcota bacterium]